jgi:cutinase
MLSTQDNAFVSSAVIFGDPDNGQAVGNVLAANTKVICATGDLICAGQAIILAPHLSYGRNANEAAQFVMSNMAAGAAAAAAAGGPADAAGAAPAGADTKAANRAGLAGFIFKA